ncbi:hypothetical protein Vretimale_7143 [Volvox reticuliferus]|uniref:Peptidase M50 domain-containing protein n=1 Tax=Volvox reticuliferus TaxID=1737510 RepID=A0A8J4G8G1_9CHLO|nr:hypothetical protein Vretifemale_11123 [Volvox reticuliferus]GIM02294.1 hypothetical protein Vretimale_7143 [Volvox reticuliferus]
MNLFRFTIGSYGSLLVGMSISSRRVVGAAKVSAGKLRVGMSALQSHMSEASNWPSRLRFVRQYFSDSASRPAVAQQSAWGFSAGSALGLGAAIGGIGYLCGGDAPGGATVALTTAMLLNLSIVVHEAGHMAAARAMDVAVQEFSVGIGPRVAWWQGPTTTYSLRAVPLLGFVSFLTQRDLAKAEAKYGKTYGMYGGGAHGRVPAGRLLASLSPGRRAVVMAAGVAANVMLAAAFVCWQIAVYGEVGHVVRSGARIINVGGWAGDGEDDAGKTDDTPQLRLRPGDVVLSVGRWRLPAGGAVEDAFVSALRAAASEPPPPPSAYGDADSSECDSLVLADAVRSLDGVKMTVLRTCTNGGSGGLVPERVVLQMDASDVLLCENLVIAPNLRVGFRHPADTRDALQMAWKELSRCTTAVLECWTDFLATAIGGKNSSSSSGGGDGAPGSSSNPDGGSMRFVGPLGLVATATEVVVSETQLAIGSSSSTGSDIKVGDGSDGGRSTLVDESIGRQPHPLLRLGVLLNLQLALFNLLPLPVLDGGQLLLVALEAARGGRRLSPFLECSALMGSLALVGGWMLAVNVRDLVALADRAADKLAVLMESQYGMYGSFNAGFSHHQQEQKQRHRRQQQLQLQGQHSHLSGVAGNGQRLEQDEADFSGAAAAAVA